ncbi:MAG TPA: ATP synthase F1 subunit gamma [Candidatus Eisenbacteria bacterium]|nr:ATP synthase F1 subunit gamma [Candidatus Eisenbacteria bacterium]
MPSTLALRRRIKTAQNISKTTRAMQMIAASKLKRAQQAALASRPYVEKLSQLSQSIAPKESTEDTSHPLLRTKQLSNKTLYVVISPDKGLCGGLNTNLFREYLKYNKDDKSLFIAVGKKIEAIAGSTTKNLLASFHAGTTLPSFGMVSPISTIITEHFTQGKIDKVVILTTHFNSVFSQTPHMTQLLPVVFPENGQSVQEKLIEPSPTELLPALLKRYVDMVIYQQLLESYASFNAAQMIAMQNATSNAKDIVSDLTLLYNKVRQEKITSEILDISSAAVALNA